MTQPLLGSEDAPTPGRQSAYPFKKKTPVPSVNRKADRPGGPYLLSNRKADRPEGPSLFRPVSFTGPKALRNRRADRPGGLPIEDWEAVYYPPIITPVLLGTFFLGKKPMFFKKNRFITS